MILLMDIRFMIINILKSIGMFAMIVTVGEFGSQIICWVFELVRLN